MKRNAIGILVHTPRPLLAAAALVVGVTFAQDADAALKVLPLGDSITFGSESTNGNGYRGPLQALLNGTNTIYDIVGTLQDGTPDIDPDHYGISGIKAHDFGNDSKSLYRQLQINNVLDTLDTAGTYPDTVLLHIGTNTFNGGGGGDPAGVELDFLLRALTTTDTGSGFYSGDNGTDNIVLARILPKAGNTTAANTDGGVYSALTQHQARVKSSFDYNYGGLSNPNWANGIASVATNRSQYLDRVSLVDMFRIDVDSLNIQYLLNEFGSGLGITTAQEMRDILSPEDDTLNGNAADWVDWVLNYDEVNNAFGPGTDGINTDLYAPGDTIHPGDLGYAVMAQIWFNDGLDLILGDINGDRFVGLEDINFVLSHWNQTVTPGDETMGELTNDGFVGIDDLNVILSNWNAGTIPSPTAEVALIPEPASLSLMLVLTGTLLRRVR
jgi:lysophospholipase L1-like esterase